MAIGAFASRWIRGFEFASGDVERGAHLRVARRTAQARDRGRAHRRQDAAMELLVQRNQAPTRGQAIASWRVAASSQRRRLGDDRGQPGGSRCRRSAAFKTMPLRLNGLEPDDASGLGMDRHDRANLGRTAIRPSARGSRSRCSPRMPRAVEGPAEARATIIETKLRGQPRAAKADATDADRKHRTVTPNPLVHAAEVGSDAEGADRYAVLIEFDHSAG